MTLARYSDTVTNTKTGGTPYPIVGALVAVKSQSGSTPTLYADDGVTVLANPLTTDEYGTYYFNAPADFYDLKYYYGGREILARVGVAVGTPTLPTGYILDSMGTATNIAPSQRAVTDAISGFGTDIADIEDEVALLTSQLPARYGKSGDTTRTATTTLAPDSDLQVTLAANALVVIKGKIFYTTTAAANFKWRHTGPASPNRVRVEQQAVAPGNVVVPPVIDTAFSSSDNVITGSAGSGSIDIAAVISNGTTAGAFGISWAQNTSDAGDTIVEAGSYLEAIAIPAPAVIEFADPGIAKLGEWVTFYGGRPAGLGVQDSASYVEFIATGYKLTAVMYGNGANCTLVIDGVSQVLSPPAGWTTVTLFDGLTDGPHRVKLSAATGAANACAFDAANTFNLSSHGTPSITRPSDISNYWPLGLAPYTTYGALDTTPAFGGGFGVFSHPYTWHGDGFEMRFKATTDQIQIYSYGYGSEQYVVLQDGIQVADVAIPADSAWGLRTLATGLSGAHEYEVFQRVAISNSTTLAVLAATIDHTPHPVLDLDAWYGDSIVVASVLTDIRDGENYRVARAGGRAARRLGTGGARASIFGRDNTALVTGLAQTPVKIFECFGVNDMQGAVNLATFQADVQTMLVNLRAGCPSAKIYCRGILPVASTVSNYTQRNAYNAAKAAAVAAIGDSNIVYVNTDGWLNPTTDLYDGLHPNAAGYAKTAAAQLLVM